MYLDALTTLPQVVTSREGVTFKLSVSIFLLQYIVIPKSDSELERAMEQVSDTDSSEEEESAEFRQVFSLPITECPQRGITKLLIFQSKSGGIYMYFKRIRADKHYLLFHLFV